MRTIHATTEQVEALLAADDGGPVAIVNLLRFKPTADYPADAPEAAEGLSGKAAYDRYAEAFRALIAEFGGRTVYWGDVLGYTIGQGEWDAVWINRFPNLAALRDASTDPRYADMHRHREAGLAYQEAIATRPAD